MHLKISIVAVPIKRQVYTIHNVVSDIVVENSKACMINLLGFLKFFSKKYVYK